MTAETPKDLSKLTCLVKDYGSFFYLAQRLARDFGKVKYFVPYRSNFSISDNADIGKGFSDVERINDFWTEIDKADIIVYPDVQDSDEQKHLRKLGFPVYGSGGGEELELDRLKFIKTLKELDLPLIKTDIRKGAEAIRKYLKENDDKYIKSSYYRGDVNTIHHKNYKHTRPWLDQLFHKIGERQHELELLLSDPIKSVVELGYDGFVIDGKYTDTALIGYEVKDAGYIGKVDTYGNLPRPLKIVNDKFASIWKGKDYYGAFSSEVRIVKKENKLIPYFIDPSCYSEDTEILTDDGWKFFKDLNQTEKVATLNSKTREIEYHKPYAYQCYEYNGDMISLEGKSIDVFVTPDHSMYTERNGIIKEQNILHISHNRSIPRTGLWKGNTENWFTLPSYQKNWHSGKGKGIDKSFFEGEKKINLCDWAEFLGIYIAEGSTGKYSVQISQFTKVKDVEKILLKMPFKIKRNKGGFSISSVQLVSYLKQFGKCNEKFAPIYIKNANSKIINHFLNGFCLGDGTIRENGARRFYTTSKKLANDIQELLFKVNSVGNIYCEFTKGTLAKFSKKTYIRNFDKYIISERLSQKSYLIDNRVVKLNKKTYKGNVYDITVHNHIIYVRRNGKPLWSGNCREPNPPAGCRSEIFSNYSDIVWNVANGQIPKPDAIAKYAAEIMLTTSETDIEVAIDIPKEDMNWIKLSNATKKDGQVYILPDAGMIGSAVGLGNTPEKAMELALERAKKVESADIHFEKDITDKMKEVIKNGQSIDIKF